MRKPKKTLEVRAPHYGMVRDVNVYCRDAATIENISTQLYDAGASFLHDGKAQIDGFRLDHRDNALRLTVWVRGNAYPFELGVARAETTEGGLAYNIFLNLVVLDRSLENQLEVRAVTGAPLELINALASRGVPTGHLVPATVRTSLMLVAPPRQLNLVPMNARLLGEVPQYDAPDVAVLSSYPEPETAGELALIARYLEQHPQLRLYFNPGSTQIQMGVRAFADVLRHIEVVTMKLDEAAGFLALPLRSNRHLADARRYAETCASVLLQSGVRAVVLNDAENGSFFVCHGTFLHTPAFPKAGIAELLATRGQTPVENFSGCGDGIFSALLYSLECYAHKSWAEHITFASRMARLISLLPASNLRGLTPEVIQSVLQISRE